MTKTFKIISLKIRHLELISERKDIIAGDKGTGKTAIFKILHQRYPQIESIRSTVVIPAFNLNGNPIFQELLKGNPLSEVEYINLWKAFILALVGNWILRFNSSQKHQSLKQLDSLLTGLALRSVDDSPRPVFQKILAKVGGYFQWKSAELAVSTNADGSFLFKPHVEFGKPSAPTKPSPSISVEAALQLLDKALKDIGKSAWVAIDRLDEAFQGAPQVEIPALRALFRCYLDLSEFSNIKLKLFVRRDLFSRIVEGGFVNLSHVNSRKIEIVWDDDDLLSLLSRRIKQSKEFFDNAKLKGKSDKAIFGLIFPIQVDRGTRRPQTWDWVLSRIKDGNSTKPPRNLIDLITMAKDAQLRREDRDHRTFETGIPIIEGESLKKALSTLSETRVNDTLLAEARQLAPVVEKFRRGKAEHNEQSLAEIFQVSEIEVRAAAKPLVQLGFLEESGGTYKVPILYRSGLEITQGKAFP